jgi:hypothetical protein
VCVSVALVIQHIKSMHRIIFCGLSGSAIFFPHYLINGTIFRKTLLNVKCVLIFCKTFVWDISHSKKNSERYYHKCICLHVEYPLFLLDFNETSVLSREFRKILRHQISWKFVLCEPSYSMRTGGHTEMTKLIVSIRSFADSPEKG